METLQIGPDNKSLNELKDEVRDLNKTIKKAIKKGDDFSLILIALGLIQVMIGLYQFIYTLLSGAGNQWLGIFWIFIIGISIFIIIKGIDVSRKDE